MGRNRVCAWVLCVACVTTWARASAAEERARDLAAACTTCHGSSGRAAGGMPALAGKSKAELLRALMEFRAGASSATVMPQLARGYSESELDVLAEFFSRQK